MITEKHSCPADPRYYVVLDHTEAYPDDPGQGTPAMVYGPHHASATFDCATDTGELMGNTANVAFPRDVARWLEGITEYVEAYVDAAFDEARLKAAKA